MSNQVLKQQKMIYGAAVTVVILISFGFYCLLTGPDNSSEDQAGLTSYADLPSDKESPQELILSRIETQNRMLESRIQFLEKTLIETQKRGEEAARSKESENQKLADEISQLKNVLQEEKSKALEVANIEDSQESFFFNAPFQPMETPPAPPRTLAFIEAENPRHLVQTVDRTIPSGTTVRAVLVSSVDAICSVMSASDPQPIKLRILDDGHLPKRVSAKLKGGLVIASAYGDLSSERVYMRPERLTQVKSNGEFVETSITGFITGEDGKNGLRGSVVDKSSKIVGNAAISGAFSGASQYLQAMIRSKYCGFGGYYGCGPGNCAPCDQGAGACYPYGLDVAGEGAANGASSGLDLLTRYYIQRAEQVRPVIQVTAGRIVDITFTHSAELGDLYTKERVREIREESRQ